MQNINVNIGDILTMVELTTLLILILPSSIYYIIMKEKIVHYSEMFMSQHKEAYVMPSYHGTLCHDYHSIPTLKWHYTGRIFTFTSEFFLHTVASPL